MKKLIITTALLLGVAKGLIAQTYQHDFQKVVGLPYNGVTNYTLDKTSDGGYVMATLMEDAGGGIDQKNLVVYKMDAGFNVTWELACELDLDLYGGAFRPYDIQETNAGGYIITGVLIVEGVADNGGFLLHLRNAGRGTVVYDWLQVYPNSSAGGYTPVSSLHKVVETSRGFMAIGRSRQGPETRGVVIGTSGTGDIQWANFLFDNQYPGNIQSTLTDMVVIDPDQVAIVGTVNSFVIDDADIMVTKIKSDGTVSDQRVYERAKKVFGDGQPAFLERGEAITYNPHRRSLVIAGTATMKEEGHCVAAEFRRLLTLEVDYATLNVNWSTMHEIEADLLIENDGLYCRDIAYNEHANGYGITGKVLNNIFAPDPNDNGYVLRVNEAGSSTNLRYYGTEVEEGFYTIEPGTGSSFAIGGTTKIGSKNYAWAVDSYENILDECNQMVVDHLTNPYPLQKKAGQRSVEDVRNLPTDCVPWSPLIEDDVLCESIILARGMIVEPTVQGAVSTFNETKVYPTYVTDGWISIENLEAFGHYTVYGINGSKQLVTGDLDSGLNRINLGELSSGFYTVVLTDAEENQKMVKIIVE